MNDGQFDSWTRRLARGGSRRQVLRLMASSALGLAFVGKVRPAKADDLPAYLHPLLDDEDAESYMPDPAPGLLNPERGIYYWWDFTGFNEPALELVPHTLKAEWLYLFEVCDQELTWNGHHKSGTSSQLDKYADSLVNHRKAGTKVVFRPRYDARGNDKPSSNTCGKFQAYSQLGPAETRALQLRHIDAVAAMLAEFKDVVAFIEAGYLGRWGEWNTFGYPGSAPLLDSTSDRAAVLRHILQKYNEAGLMQHIGLRTPVFAAEAIALKPDARVGSYNDCFMSSLIDAEPKDQHDTGTYLNFPGSPQNFSPTSQNPDKAKAEVVNYWRNWAVKRSENSSWGGETCSGTPAGKEQERWRWCSNMIGAGSEPASLHLSYLHGAHELDAIKTWVLGDDDGETCYEEIQRRLGYRFEVRRVRHTPSVSTGQRFQVEIEIANTGWSKLHKPRQAKLVLRGKSAPSHVFMDASGAGAVASWATGQTVTLSFSDVVDVGTYSVRLWIPDPDDPTNPSQDPDVKGNIDYAVKLATLRDNGTGQLENVFDSTTGDNDLGLTITVQ
jgi:hypothetical protein